MWENGKEIWELVHVSCKDDFLEMAKNSFDNKLTNTTGYQWEQRYKKYAKRFAEPLVRVYIVMVTEMTKSTKFKLKLKFQMISIMLTFWARKKGINCWLMPLPWR